MSFSKSQPKSEHFRPQQLDINSDHDGVGKAVIVKAAFPHFSSELQLRL